MIILCKNGHLVNQIFQYTFTKKLDQKSIVYSCYLQELKQTGLAIKKLWLIFEINL